LSIAGSLPKVSIQSDNREGSDIEALENKIEGFKSERNVVQSAEPDYLVGIK